MDIYAPIAQRLGISKIKIELDDLSLKYLESGSVLSAGKPDLNERKTKREEFVQQIVAEVSRAYGECKHQSEDVRKSKAFLQYL